MGEQLRLGGFERGKASSVDGAGAEAVDGLEMFRGAIALVEGESITRVHLFELEHQTVAGDLGDDARGGDRVTERVALDHGRLGTGEPWDREAVDQDVLSGGNQGVERAAHGFVGSAEDVDGIDGGSVEAGDLELHLRVVCKFREELLASGGCELFGIVQRAQGRGQAVAQPGKGKDHGHGRDGTGQRAAPGFVDAGDPLDTASDQFAFIAQAVAFKGSGVPDHGGDGCDRSNNMQSETVEDRAAAGRGKGTEARIPVPSRIEIIIFHAHVWRL
jgi:hypothetical protein